MMNDELKKLIQTRHKFLGMLSDFPESQREKILFGEWSLKEIVAHISAWIIHDLMCLDYLVKGKIPFWEPSIIEFNQKAAKESQQKSWSAIYREYVEVSGKLIKAYESLPPVFWEKKFWPNRSFTPMKFVKGDISHLADEHMPLIEKYVASE